MSLHLTPGLVLRAGRTLTLDVVRAYAALPTALARLDDTLAGYPTGIDGDGSEDASIVERLALADVDRARRDRTELTRVVERMSNESVRLLALVDQWSTYNGRRPIGRDVRHRWCISCARFGHSTPRAHERQRCRWCDDYHRANDQDPPRALVERHLNGERITQRDVELAKRKRKG